MNLFGHRKEICKGVDENLRPKAEKQVEVGGKGVKDYFTVILSIVVQTKRQQVVMYARNGHKREKRSSVG